MSRHDAKALFRSQERTPGLERGRVEGVGAVKVLSVGFRCRGPKRGRKPCLLLPRERVGPVRKGPELPFFLKGSSLRTPQPPSFHSSSRSLKGWRPTKGRACGPSHRHPRVSRNVLSQVPPFVECPDGGGFSALILYSWPSEASSRKTFSFVRVFTRPACLRGGVRGGGPETRDLRVTGE